MSPDAVRVRDSAQWVKGRKRSRYYLVYTSQRGGEINCDCNPVCSENADELHENLRDPSRLDLLTAEVQVKWGFCSTQMQRRIGVPIYQRRSSLLRTYLLP